MPENETLFPNCQTASRWNPLRDRIEGGEPLDELFPDLHRQFYKALQRAFEQCKKRGVDHKQLFEAAMNNRDLLHDLVEQTGYHDYAQLLQNVTFVEPNSELEGVIRGYLDSVWENVRGLLQIDCRDGGVPNSFWCSVDQMLERLRRSLLENPSNMPRCPRKQGPMQDIEDILKESLPLA